MRRIILRTSWPARFKRWRTAVVDFFGFTRRTFPRDYCRECGRFLSVTKAGETRRHKCNGEWR
jgi:hypothetical protein